MQRVLGYDALSTGLVFLPFCLGSVVGMITATRTLVRAGQRAIIVVGGLTGALGIACGSDCLAAAGSVLVMI
ncbi:hypothetical protein [Actinomadura sp. 3N407]|uniref:hypothetical protein n=1 Tax=Actinomadura sp. 3N407 TaxID=3457423 RepID=UPI003FCD55E4